MFDFIPTSNMELHASKLLLALHDLVMPGYTQGILWFSESDGAAVVQTLKIGLRQLTALMSFMNGDIVPDPKSEQNGRS